ncbi:conserved hypothetical protein [Rubrivivax sp. A210]|uniref:UPF0149 family protein n=1 Tax=Rubrivivax sp. A210 TaxID=2772301 RepID=UPI00191A5D16|nr:UPF0149 family protein [Rubrivivax sp. A210]CAD5372204.1 conserved hypothetical protein [Rubrivivax sp. A210]
MSFAAAAARPPQNSEAEIAAFDTVCERLAGFDPELSFEWVDGFLAALAAGPRLPPVDEWLPALAGDAFERAFADPEDHAQALSALQARLTVLGKQLDAEVLLEDPEALRLDPLMSEWTDEDRAKLAEQDSLNAEEVASVQTGGLWAVGFMDGVEAFPVLWDEPADEEAALEFGQLMDQVAALMLAPGSEEFKEHVLQYYPKGDPTRDELIAEACWAVQDLRLYWVEHAPRPATRRVEPTPGRNDPCPCGSGKKFKKCHGAAA